MGDLETKLDWMRDGEDFFSAALSALENDQLGERGLLPGWTRSEIVAHVARNADALQNLLHWARTGEETPMYASPGQRDADIAEGALRPPAELRDNAASASRSLRAAVDSLPSSAWEASVRTARGRTVPATEIPWMRCREVWIHGVDLDAGSGFDAVRRDVALALIDDVVTGLAARGDCPAVVLVSSEDENRSWALGPDSGAVVVEGTPSALLAWVSGRSSGDSLSPRDRAAVPALPGWL